MAEALKSDNSVTVNFKLSRNLPVLNNSLLLTIEYDDEAEAPQSLTTVYENRVFQET